MLATDMECGARWRLGLTGKLSNGSKARRRGDALRLACRRAFADGAGSASVFLRMSCLRLCRLSSDCMCRRYAELRCEDVSSGMKDSDVCGKTAMRCSNIAVSGPDDMNGDGEQTSFSLQYGAVCISISTSAATKGTP